MASHDGSRESEIEPAWPASGGVEVTRKQLLRGIGAAGAASLVDVEPAAASGPRTREHWIAAVPTTWNVMPNGRDGISGQLVEPSRTVTQTVIYRAFTRGWRKPLRQPQEMGLGAGIPGPLLRARVGDTLVVHFKNMDTEFHRPHSIHFHGVHYDFASDGSFIPGFSGRGGNVKPGQTYTYRLEVGQDSVGVWPYHDHSPSMHESIIGGLYGALSILPRGQRRPDQEFVVFFAPMLEFMAINGRAFVGNTPVFRAKVGEVVQWDVLTLGDDFHTFHIHGHRWQAADGTFVDTRHSSAQASAGSDSGRGLGTRGEQTEEPGKSVERACGRRTQRDRCAERCDQQRRQPFSYPNLHARGSWRAPCPSLIAHRRWLTHNADPRHDLGAAMKHR